MQVLLSLADESLSEPVISLDGSRIAINIFLGYGSLNKSAKLIAVSHPLPCPINELHVTPMLV